MSKAAANVRRSVSQGDPGCDAEVPAGRFRKRRTVSAVRFCAPATGGKSSGAQSPTVARPSSFLLLVGAVSWGLLGALICVFLGTKDVNHL